MEHEPNPEKEIALCTTNNKEHNHNFKILFFNAQSLPSKTDELNILLNQYEPAVVGVVETWLDASHSEGSYNMEEVVT